MVPGSRCVVSTTSTSPSQWPMDSPPKVSNRSAAGVCLRPSVQILRTCRPPPAVKRPSPVWRTITSNGPNSMVLGMPEGMQLLSPDSMATPAARCLRMATFRSW